MTMLTSLGGTTRMRKELTAHSKMEEAVVCMMVREKMERQKYNTLQRRTRGLTIGGGGGGVLSSPLDAMIIIL